MKISFIMPGYAWCPSGGIRVVYEHANRLVQRGHKVSVVHPRRVQGSFFERNLTPYHRAKRLALLARDYLATPTIRWHPIDSRVDMKFVPNLDSANIPDGDAVIAIAVDVLNATLAFPSSKGEKFFFIQSDERFQQDPSIVRAAWRSPAHKIVIAEWLRKELIRETGSSDIDYVPNAVDVERYKLLRPIDGRERQVAMQYSCVPVKGSADGIKALKLAKQIVPELRVVLFGVDRKPSWLPTWIEYHRNPSQGFLIHQIYNQSAIYLSPSTSEGWGLPATEAAACGCALVCTDIGGHREYVRHNETGLLCTPGRPDALAESVVALLQDEDLRVKLAQAGRAWITAFLDWEKNSSLLESALSSNINHAQNHGSTSAAC